MTINPNAPIYPEKDVALIPVYDQPYNPNDYPTAGTPPQTVDPLIDWQEVDINLLPGVPGQRGPVGTQGPAGPAGAAGADGVSGGSFTFTQNAVANTWTISHSLGYHPAITTTDSSGNIIEGSVSYPSLASVVINFGIATSGFAYLS